MQSPEELIRAGVLAIRKKNFSKGESLFIRAAMIKGCPPIRMAEAHLRLGYLASYLECYDSALLHLEQTLNILEDDRSPVDQIRIKSYPAISLVTKPSMYRFLAYSRLINILMTKDVAQELLTELLRQFYCYHLALWEDESLTATQFIMEIVREFSFWTDRIISIGLTRVLCKIILRVFDYYLIRSDINIMHTVLEWILSNSELERTDPEMFNDAQNLFIAINFEARFPYSQDEELELEEEERKWPGYYGDIPLHHCPGRD